MVFICPKRWQVWWIWHPYCFLLFGWDVVNPAEYGNYSIWCFRSLLVAVHPVWSANLLLFLVCPEKEMHLPVFFLKVCICPRISFTALPELVLVMVILLHHYPQCQVIFQTLLHWLLSLCLHLQGVFSLLLPAVLQCTNSTLTDWSFNYMLFDLNFCVDAAGANRVGCLELHHLICLQIVRNIDKIFKTYGSIDPVFLCIWIIFKITIHPKESRLINWYISFWSVSS